MVIKFLKGLKKRHFKGVLTQMHKNNAQGWLKEKIIIVLKKLCAWDVTAHHDLPR